MVWSMIVATAFFSLLIFICAPLADLNARLIHLSSVFSLTNNILFKMVYASVDGFMSAMAITAARRTLKSTSTKTFAF